MRKYILIAGILYSGSALSQEQKQFTLSVTAGDIGVIAQGLGTMPYKDAAPLLKKLDEQLAAQSKPPEQKPVEPVPHIEPQK